MRSIAPLRWLPTASRTRRAARSSFPSRRGPAASAQRSELAEKLISTQESTLRHISRELHDEFGQILTAVGAMLSRAGNHAPEGSALRSELREVCEITQSTLDKVRSLSQALHPVMLE